MSRPTAPATAGIVPSTPSGRIHAAVAEIEAALRELYPLETFPNMTITRDIRLRDDSGAVGIGAVCMPSLRARLVYEDVWASGTGDVQVPN